MSKVAAYNISILIPIHNRIEITKQGLNFLYSALKYYADCSRLTINYKVIIIDDGSTDGSSDWIIENYKQTIILTGDGNLWWGGAINKGLEYVLSNESCSHVILWNDDTKCSEDYFVRLEEYLNDPTFNRSILASKILWEDDRSVLFNYGCLFNKRTGRSTIIGFNEKSANFKTPIKIDWSGGMGTVIPIYIIKEIGLVDSAHFPQYHGDMDFFLRSKKNGYEAFAVPTLVIWNNRYSTGILLKKPYTKSLVQCLVNKRSWLNLRQNIILVKRHTTSNIAFLFLFGFYLKLFT